MFKRSEEQEWTRFRGILSKDREEAPAEDEEESEVLSVQPTRSERSDAAPSTTVSTPTISGTSRPIISEPSGLTSSLRPSGPIVPENQQVETLIGANSSFDGKLRTEGAVRILGSIEGELEAKGPVYVEESARLNAKVTGTQVVVAGRIDGQILSDGRVEIRPTGHVTGEISATALIVQEGAFFEGTSRMRGRERERDREEASQAPIPTPRARAASR